MAKRANFFVNARAALTTIVWFRTRNPIQWARIIRCAFRPEESGMSKSIFQSKTFWVNALTLGATVAGALPPKYAAMALPAVNIALRVVTADPVHVLGE